MVIIWQTVTEWTAQFLTVDSVTGRMSVADDGSALVVLTWLQGTDALGLTFCADVFAIPNVTVAASSELPPLTSLRRPLGRDAEATLRDIAFSRSGVAILAANHSRTRIFQFDVETGRWSEGEFVPREGPAEEKPIFVEIQTGSK